MYSPYQVFSCNHYFVLDMVMTRVIPLFNHDINIVIAIPYKRYYVNIKNVYIITITILFVYTYIASILVADLIFDKNVNVFTGDGEWESNFQLQIFVEYFHIRFHQTEQIQLCVNNF